MVTLVNKDQAINVLFAAIEMKIDNYKDNIGENMLKDIDDAKEYVLRNLI